MPCVTSYTSVSRRDCIWLRRAKISLSSIHLVRGSSRGSTTRKGVCRAEARRSNDPDGVTEKSNGMDFQGSLKNRLSMSLRKHHATDDMLLSRMGIDQLTTHADQSHGGGEGVTSTSEDFNNITPDAVNQMLLLRRGQKYKFGGSKKVKTVPRTEVTQQHFGGALTTLVFGAALLSERLNGVGIVQNLELHNKGFHPVLLGAILCLLVASAWPEKREWKNPGLLVRIQMAGARFAYLGLAAAIAAEMVTGRGVLSLLDVETGIEAFSDVEAVLVFLTMLVLTGPQSREIR